MAGLTYTAIDAVNLSTAEVYGKALCDMAKTNENIVALSSDLQRSTKIGSFAELYPNRFFNIGIAEQNMLGIASGLAKVGYVPFVSTYGVFATMRALEQLRTDICYQNLNVNIIGSHSGLSFGQAGSTHQATEDLSILRGIPNITVICTADGLETANAVQAAYEIDGPTYIRINRGFDSQVYETTEYGFEVGKAITLNEGTDLTIIACGSAVYQAQQAINILKEVDGLSVRLLNMHTIKPIDKEAILSAVMDTRRIITVEDHNVLGGLGSAVSEVIAESGKACSFKRLGIPDEFSIIGLHEDLMAYYGYDTNGIVDSVREVMGKDFEDDESWEDEV